MPDLPVVVAYSDMYGVTTDYLLKGGEMKRIEDPYEGMELKKKQLAMKIIEDIKEYNW